MTDDEEQKYHHNASEGETRAPAGERIDPHHALNTPVAAIDEADAALSTQKAERRDDAVRAEEAREREERSPDE